MQEFKCTICGFIYDEATGVSEKGVAPGTKWEDVPNEFLCPLCGAPKSLFVEVVQNKESDQNIKEINHQVGQNRFSKESLNEDFSEFSSGELSAIWSNLAKGSEKQQLMEATSLFFKLSDYFKDKGNMHHTNTLEEVHNLLKSDLKEGYAKATQVASEYKDRGALRSLVWSEKVSNMNNILLDRFAREEDSMLANTRIYVCDICGFVYLGDVLPDVCPVCKVPNYKISEIIRR
jgi:rubredoxin